MKNQNREIKRSENLLALVPETRPSYEDMALTNPNKEALAPSVLKSFVGFESISEEEAENTCRISLLLAQILLEYLAHKNNTSIDNQQVVYSMGDSDAPVISIDSNKSKPRKNKAA